MDAKISYRNEISTPRYIRRALLSIAMLIALPIYVVKTEDGITLGPSLMFDSVLTRPSFGLAIAVFLLLPLLPYLAVQSIPHFWRGIKDGNKTLIFASTLLIWMSMAVIYGASTGDQPLMSGLFYAQTILPLVVFLVFYLVPVGPGVVDQMLKVFVVASSVSIAIILLALVILLGIWRPLTAWSFVQEGLYGVKNIQPAIVLISMAICLTALSAFSNGDGNRARPFAVGLFFSCCFLMVTWSRVGVVAAVALMAIWVALELSDRRLGSVRHATNLWLAAVSGAMALVVAVNLTVGGVTLRTSANQLYSWSVIFKSFGINLDRREDKIIEVDGDDDELERKLEGGTARRQTVMLAAIKRIVERPVFGDSFRPTSDGDHLISVRRSGGKIFPAHNQYLDLAIRSGVPALLLFLGLLASIFVELKKGFGPDFLGKLRRMGVVLLVLFAVAGLGQLYFVVTQASVAFFIFLGLILNPLNQGRSAM